MREIAGRHQSRNAGLSDFVSMRPFDCALHASSPAVLAFAVFVRRGGAINVGSNAEGLLTRGPARFFGRTPWSPRMLAAGMRAFHDLVQVHNVIAGAHHGRSPSQ